MIRKARVRRSSRRKSKETRERMIKNQREKLRERHRRRWVQEEERQKGKSQCMMAGNLQQSRRAAASVAATDPPPKTRTRRLKASRARRPRNALDASFLLLASTGSSSRTWQQGVESAVLRASSRLLSWSTWQQRFWSWLATCVRTTISSALRRGTCKSQFVVMRSLRALSRQQLLEVVSSRTSISPCSPTFDCARMRPTRRASPLDDSFAWILVPK
mmetsp:Transcript_1978/g.4750  ORF Transcript_1978/g.4750 Transcript_1978/m.4750 type:complete len:217 (-) Transcript_1978:297-947(-)